jgi:hypothetical protein
LRLGLSGEIFSKNYHYILGRTMIAGTEVLSIAYKECDHILYDGTRVIIHNWGRDESIYPEMFIDSEDIYNHYNEHGGIILNPDFRGHVFVRGVFVQVNPLLHFGYNLNDVTMVKGRSTIQDYEIFRNIGKIMKDCTDNSIWALYFKSIKENNLGEKLIDFPSYNLESSVNNAISEGFKVIFGDSVIGTSRNMMNQAKHLGRESVFGDIFGQDLRTILSNVVGYDEGFVTDKLGQPFQIISSHKIDDNQKITLKYIRKIADRINFDKKLIKIAGDGAEFDGLWDGRKGVIFLKDSILKSLPYTIGVFLHEVAHFNTHAEDLTDEHTREIQRLAGKILESYMLHGK